MSAGKIKWGRGISRIYLLMWGIWAVVWTSMFFYVLFVERLIERVTAKEVFIHLMMVWIVPAVVYWGFKWAAKWIGAGFKAGNE